MSILQPNSPLAKLVAKIKAIPVASSNLPLLVDIALTSKIACSEPHPHYIPYSVEGINFRGWTRISRILFQPSCTSTPLASNPGLELTDTS